MLMTKKKQTRGEEKRTPVQALPSKLISRRTALGIAGGTTLLALIGGRLLLSTEDQKKEEFDYLFFGVDHYKTPTEDIVRVVELSGVERVGLEGLPQGVIDDKVYAALEPPYRAHLAAREALWEEITSFFDPQKNMQTIKILGLKGAIPQEEVKGLCENIDAITFLLLNAYSFAYSNRQVGNQFNFVKPLREKGVEVIGLEDPALFQDTSEIMVNRLLHYFFENKYAFVEHMDSYASKTSDASLQALFRSFASSAEFLQNIAYREGIAKHPASHYRGNGFITHVLQEFDTIVIEGRSRAWMEYAQPFTPLAIVAGLGHTSINEAIARVQGKKYAEIKINR